LQNSPSFSYQVETASFCMWREEGSILRSIARAAILIPRSSAGLWIREE